MSSDQRGTGHGQAGGQGRLAEVLATRGGRAAPEAPFVIEHREALIYMLCEAAELEHGIMCQYLFAVFSLKQAAAEGLSAEQLDAVLRWRKQISHVAAQEMLHLALVHNLLSAIGGAPHLARPNLPAPAAHYPAGVQLALIPFGEKALRHFMFLERPEGMDLADADGLAATRQAAPLMNERDIVPRGQDFATVGHLYRSIEAGFAHLAARNGEDWLFVGPPGAQATQEHFGWPELVPVTDLASAQRAIEEILEQGEGPRGHWRDAHFGQFVAILDEYQQLTEADPAFDPVRPVMAANVRAPERETAVPLITDPLTARVADLFNVGYEILLQMFERFFAHTDESDAELKVLADATVGVMLRVIKPLGDLITTLPAGDGYPGLMAGPSFELFYESDYLMPHKEAAWSLLAERLDEAAWLCEAIRSGRGTALAARLEPVLGAMRDISRTLAARLPDQAAHARLAVPPARLEQPELEALVRRADDLAATATSGRAGAGPGRELSDLARSAHAIVAQAAAGLGCDAAQQAMIVPRLVNSVLRPLAAAAGRVHADQGASATAAGDGVDPAAAAADRHGAGDGVDPAAAAADQHGQQEPVVMLAMEVASAATVLRARLGHAGSCPPELAEATAALQHLACALVPPGEAQERRARLWELQAGLPPTIQAASNGPYLVTNVARLTDYLGGSADPLAQIALCRCGNSAIKPLCDGSHHNGFSDNKDPGRVPDRRDTYDGQQLTIFDNRGICQHSGLCTDRLATVFRSGAEPFVAPSGGRLDEIIRAVRDCPSGALSYAIDGTEARAQADWTDTREPAIEITRDGPYRVTGRIPLTGAAGELSPRAEGSSLEHYALCRCGHSQNKPFCSGMHWYVGFRDPVPRPGHEPTLFEWAGGLPGLSRMTRLLYEKHVPADPVLALAFAGMPADQPLRLARWLAAAFGGPVTGGPVTGDSVISESAADGQDGEFAAAGIAPPGGKFSQDQRARWVALAGTAADEAGLPTDPAFRSAFAACVEWGSRAAAAQPPDAGAGAPVLARWAWGPGGPPAVPDDQAPGNAPPEVRLPGPDEQVSYAAHIRPLFSQRDRQSMSFAFDLWAVDDVRAHAADILARIENGSMPCDGAWPPERTDVLRRWIGGGQQP